LYVFSLQFGLLCVCSSSLLATWGHLPKINCVQTRLLDRQTAWAVQRHNLLVYLRTAGSLAAAAEGVHADEFEW
jgi:hypothetical protein